MILEQLEEAISNSRRIRKPMSTCLGEGKGRGLSPVIIRIMGYGRELNLDALWPRGSADYLYCHRNVILHEFVYNLIINCLLRVCVRIAVTFVCCIVVFVLCIANMFYWCSRNVDWFQIRYGCWIVIMYCMLVFVFRCFNICDYVITILFCKTSFIFDLQCCCVIVIRIAIMLLHLIDVLYYNSFCDMLI